MIKVNTIPSKIPQKIKGRKYRISIFFLKLFLRKILFFKLNILFLCINYG